MKIAMIGTGYVGLVSGACFSEMGNDVICVDVNTQKIENLKNGIIPIYEPGLEDMVLKNSANGSLTFSTDFKGALEKAHIIFVAVGTPMGEDGSADLQYVLGVAKEIGQNMTHHLIVVDKSTVPVGTGERVRAAIQAELDARKSDLTFDVVSNPEFLKEGDAVKDFMKPDRVVVGADNEKALEEMRELYAPFMHSHERFYAMDIRSAELTKYAGNAMLTTRISFMNELALLCEKVGADINKVRVGIGSDSRIGGAFLYPSCGYGGSCFPKDVRALEKLAADNGIELKIIRSVQDVNDRQKLVIVQKVVKKFGQDLTGKTFAVWGLAFKAETDDMREASSIVIISELTKLGAKIVAYDPKAMDEAKRCYLKDNVAVSYVESKYSALTGADALILLTEWKEFRSPDFEEMKKRLKNPIIFDGRNIYDKDRVREDGFEYSGIGIA
ncbi:MAG: UDP-glucose/GDP-mannose dehydrogenase family protein [Candidatus Moraniibacteriota bacterium]|jgi:UDPglucose 6-dehydrogenase